MQRRTTRPRRKPRPRTRAAQAARRADERARRAWLVAEVNRRWALALTIQPISAPPARQARAVAAYVTLVAALEHASSLDTACHRLRRYLHGLLAALPLGVLLVLLVGGGVTVRSGSLAWGVGCGGLVGSGLLLASGWGLLGRWRAVRQARRDQVLASPRRCRQLVQAALATLPAYGVATPRDGWPELAAVAQAMAHTAQARQPPVPQGMGQIIGALQAVGTVASDAPPPRGRRAAWRVWGEVGLMVLVVLGLGSGVYGLLHQGWR